MFRVFLFSTVALAVVSFVRSAHAETTETTTPTFDPHGECGVTTQDLYRRDLTRAGGSAAYCEGYFSLPLELEGTVGATVGDETSSNVYFSLSRGFQPAERVSLELFGDIFYFWEIDQTIGDVGAETVLSLTDHFGIGAEGVVYFGDYEDVRGTLFLAGDFDNTDIELGYSWLESGAEGPSLELGHEFFNERLRLEFQAMWPDYEDEEMEDEPLFSFTARWRF